MDNKEDVFYHVENNTLTKCYTEKYTTFVFLLYSTLASMFSLRSEKIFNPLPPTYIDMEIVKRDIQTFSILTEMEILKSDQEVKDKCGDSIYNFLVFMIVSNTMNMIPTILLKLGDYKEENIQPIPQFKIEHSVSTENEFREKVSVHQSSFLYHGSRKENWYSIMRNGLKVYSNNKDMMLNGSSYGQGIYLSDNFNTSMYYCTETTKRTHDGAIDTEDDFVIGIFEVVGSKAKYKKAEGIYVVQDESQLLIRYLLHFPNRVSIHQFGVAEALNEKFNQSLKIEIKQKNMVLNRIAQKRLMSDFRKIQTSITTTDSMKISLRDEDNLAIWDVKLNGFLPGSRMEHDLTKYGYKEGIHIEVRFPEDFPNHPPFIRIVSPRFEVMTGHVTSGGSVCMEVLTNQGWRPTYYLENLLVDIQQMILDGNGGLDPRWHGRAYTLEEAHRAFDRMSATHGWY
jgi:ubiquitin-protein ligase